MYQKLALFAVLFAITLTVNSATASDTWGKHTPTNYSDGTWVEITREKISSSEYQWTYYLHHGASGATALHQFSVGLLVDDTGDTGIGDTASGHYYDYKSSFTSTFVIESYENVTWYGFALNYGQNAWFKFKTDLPGVGYANHAARDHKYTPNWFDKETPIMSGPAIPEPSSLLVLLTGLTIPIATSLKKKSNK